MSESAHPAARHSEQLAWAVWFDDECYAVVANSEESAANKARDRHDADEPPSHIDGPYQDQEPGVWEFTYTYEFRETVVVEAPSRDYASDTAEMRRDLRGRFVQTLHTEKRRLDVDPNAADNATASDENVEGSDAN